MRVFCRSYRFWSQQIRNCILTAEGEEWDLGDRSPHHEIQPSLPRPRNNTRWVPLPQPATSRRPQYSFFPPSVSQTFSPFSPNGNKADKCPGFNHVFSSLKWFWTVCLAVCVQFFCECVCKKRKISENDTEGIAVFCMYVFSLPPVSFLSFFFIL